MKNISLKQPALWLALSAFFLPIAPAPVNIFLLCAVLALLSNKDSRASIVRNFKNPLVWIVAALVGWLAFTMLWPTSHWASVNINLAKDLRLLLIPVLGAAIYTESDRWMILDAFCVGVMLSVAASYAVALGLLPSLPYTDSPLYFKLHITHNFFIALAAPYVIWRLFTRWSEWPLNLKVFVVFGLLAALYNFLFMVEGRSGWLAIACIPAVAAYQRLGFKRALLIAIVTAMVCGALYLGSDLVHERVYTALHEVEQWHEGAAVAQETSMGRRMIFWTYSMKAILNAPLFGYGLGGFEEAIRPFAQADHFFIFSNPHNQYLLFTVQGGVIALVLYLLFLVAIIKYARGPEPLILTSFVVSYAILNLLNSFHVDFSESVLFIFVVSILAFRPVSQIQPES